MALNEKARRILNRMQRRAAQADRPCSACARELVIVSQGIEVRLCGHTLNDHLPNTAVARRDEKGCGSEGRYWKFKEVEHDLPQE